MQEKKIKTQIYIDAMNLGAQRGYIAISFNNPMQCMLTLSPPEASFVLSMTSDVVSQGYRSINELARLNRVKLKLISDSRLTMLRHAAPSADPWINVPWMTIIPDNEMRESLKSIASMCLTFMNDATIDYYDNVYAKHRDAFNALSRASIDREKAIAYIEDEKNPSSASALASCIPSFGHACDRIVYDTLESQTGRMRIMSGPNVIAMKKTHRDVFKSRFNEGYIVALDLSTFEPRVAATLAGNARMTTQQDMYVDLSNQMHVSRTAAKQAVLASMFGASDVKLTSIIGSEQSQLSVLDKTFGINERSHDLLNMLSSTGCIRNAYGRPLYPKSNALNVLFNNYVQSSAVDASMIAFTNILKMIKDKQIVAEPIFFIHDCIYMDVHPDSLQYIKSLIADPIEIQGLEQGCFYVKCEVINGSEKK